MTLLESINKIIDQYFSSEKMYSVVGVVSEVDSATRTCTVSPIDDTPDLFDVRFQASESLTEGISIEPKDGSFVTVVFLNNTTGIIISTSEIKSVSIIAGAGKFDFKNTSEDLKAIISDLIDTINLLTVTTPSGPSGVPVNIADFTAIKTRLDNLFN
jgi:hypothetical protein